MSLMSAVSTLININMQLTSFLYSAQIRILNVFICVLLYSESMQVLNFLEVTHLFLPTLITEVYFIKGNSFYDSVKCWCVEFFLTAISEF